MKTRQPGRATAEGQGAVRLSEVVQEVIRLAERIRVYWDTELPKRHPDYPIVNPGEDSGPPPPEEAQLRKLLMKLPAEMIYKLVLIMYLGRDDFDTRDLAEQFREIKDDFPKSEWAVSQMMAKAPLADYLIDGLAKLSQDQIDVDRIPRKSTRVQE